MTTMLANVFFPLSTGRGGKEEQAVSPNCHCEAEAI